MESHESGTTAVFMFNGILFHLNSSPDGNLTQSRVPGARGREGASIGVCFMCAVKEKRRKVPKQRWLENQ